MRFVTTNFLSKCIKNDIQGYRWISTYILKLITFYIYITLMKLKPINNKEIIMKAAEIKKGIMVARKITAGDINYIEVARIRRSNTKIFIYDKLVYSYRNGKFVGSADHYAKQSFEFSIDQNGDVKELDLTDETTKQKVLNVFEESGSKVYNF